MPTYTPTTNWSGIQKRTIDPKSKFDSDIINHITAIGGGDRYKVSGLDMDILYDTDNKLYFHLTPGIVVKDYVVLEFTADMYILAGTWPIANGTYYLAVEYQYAKQYPPNIAQIVFISEDQLSGANHYALFKITKTGDVFPTDLSYEQLAFSDEELAQPVFIEKLAKKYVMIALGGETTINVSAYFDEYVKEYALYRNGLLQLEGYDFTFNHDTKIITMTTPLVADDIVIFLSKMWGFANSELTEFDTYSMYDLDNGALDLRYYTKPQIDNFFEGTSALGKKQINWTNVLNKPAELLDLTNIALKSNSVNQFTDLDSAGPLIDDAVAKRHSQNTDVGTSSTSFYIGTSGPKIKNNANVIELRNNADSAYANLIVNNLTVQGTTTTINSETLTINDNVIVLNNNYAESSPIENGGIEVERGTLTNASLIWDESNDLWKAGLAGSEKTIVKESNSVELTGDVTGSATFASTGNISITTTVVDYSHSHVISDVSGLQAELNSKLASASYTAADVLTKLKTVDGTDSGLDADLLDAQQGSYYLNASNLNAGTISASRGVLAESEIPSFLQYTGLTDTEGALNGGSTIPTGTKRLNFSGYFYATRVYNAVYNDYAECFDTSVSYINSKNRIIEIKDGTASIASPESSAVIGISSNSYGYILNGTEEDIISNRKIPVAMAGTVMVDAEDAIEDTDLNCFICAGIDGKARVIPEGKAYMYEGKIVGKIIALDKSSNQYKIIVGLR